MDTEFLMKLDLILDEAERLEQARLDELERQQREKALQLEKVGDFVSGVVQPIFQACALRLQEKDYPVNVVVGETEFPSIQISICPKSGNGRAELRYSFDPNTRLLHRTISGVDFGSLLNDLNGTVDWDIETPETVSRSLLLFVDMHLKYWAK
ncbi:hypothetical protein [Deinococcus cellulosilyticus]|uniref:Uncharacterized protein n=1 Tax=Deinococcus cellulosilyticus (strain DSM 18568 / NBRC 106333 / KACC 11606 / 5516J-15) TaxID=1223518 RepID=A0A511N0P1_DEIC1|nr:hypothetical protein [Deinococcus cellulosilyticus]GEM45946.1 hypothetical protein DC3_15810 [Deinococcus cellulosilyticus NBRC 106333 = KACC 11606]